jgi:pimeloyl-ACP methyl ester carboxylesterase
MNEPKQQIIESNGIHLNIAEPGEGPLVLLAHGFPESWYSWRYQISALAAGGFHVVAPDMRGYGKSDAPQAIDRYTILHLVGDMVGVLDALGAPTAVIVGHDWGASVAWQAALIRPDRFRAVAALSVPFRPAPRFRPRSCRAQRIHNSTSSTFRSRGLRKRNWGVTRARPHATLFCSGGSGEGVAAARAAAASGGPRNDRLIGRRIPKALYIVQAVECEDNGATGRWRRSIDGNRRSTRERFDVIGLKRGRQGRDVLLPSVWIGHLDMSDEIAGGVAV